MPVRSAAAKMEDAWELSEGARKATRRRAGENLFVLAYSRREKLSDKEAAQIAVKFESKAYTVARIESQTTTGNRPHAECVKAYVRCCVKAVPALGFLSQFCVSVCSTPEDNMFSV